MASAKLREDLDRDRTFQLAITHLVMIVGEAARNVSPDIKDRHPQVPWKQMAGTRDRLIHGYDRVDLNLLWEIIKSELPPLIETLGEIVGPLDPPEPRNARS